MNVARVAVLGIAVVTAGLAAFLMRNVVSSDGPAEAAVQTAALNTTKVLVAGRALGLGETIRADDLVWQLWPKEGLSPRFINQEAVPNGQTDWAGAFVRSPLVAGEPISRSKVSRGDNEGVMSTILDPGMRAIGIEISAESGAGGFILPNDRVDVILTYKNKMRVEGRQKEQLSSATILVNVRVLAIDQTFRDEDGQQVVVGRTATLELPSDLAETLVLAKASGKLSLALRSLVDPSGEANDLKPRLADSFGPEGKKHDGSIAFVRFGRQSVPGGGQ
jgi:pilus assembly protein CpaB